MALPQRLRAAATASALVVALAAIAVIDSPPRLQAAAARPTPPPLRVEKVAPRVAAPAVQIAAPLSRPPVIFSVGTSDRVVALTFDLDMSPGMAAALRSGAVRAWVNREALDQLRARHVAATIFMTGLWAQTYPALARELAQSGQFEIGNHSYSHPAFHLPCYGLWGSPPAGLATEVDSAQQAIRAATGVAPSYFRFPGGCLDPSVVAMVHAHGLTPVQWSLNSLDAFNGSAAQIARTVIAGVHPGDIIVMHLMGGPNAPASGAALRQILPALQAQGYRLVTVGELLGLGPALEPAGFRGVVEAPATRAPGRAGPPYWVWTPWGWRSLSHPPTCRWQLNARKTWVCA